MLRRASQLPQELTLTLPAGATRVVAAGTPALDVVRSIGERLARDAVAVEIEGTMDRSKPVRQDLSVFNAVQLHFHVDGVTQAQATDLVDRFKRR